MFPFWTIYIAAGIMLGLWLVRLAAWTERRRRVRVARRRARARRGYVHTRAPIYDDQLDPWELLPK